MSKSNDLLRTELIGLEVTALSDKKKCYPSLVGHIIDETKNMLIIETKEKKIKKIPKKTNVFLFHLNRESVEVKGKMLVGKPEDRIKKK
jgi:ribonuclease P protein subunit POP4